MSAPEPAVSRLPSPLTLAMAVIVTLLVAVALVHNLTDADYFWHLATGHLIAERGAVPSTDPFSFTWGGPWVAHEWLGEVLIHLLVTVAGGTLTMVVFGAVAGASIWLSAITAMRLGARTLPTVLAASVAAVILIPFVTVRPQVLSWLLLAGLVFLLRALSAEHPRRALWLGPLFLLWANLHGLWVVGLGCVVVYGLFTLAGRTPMSTARGWLLGGAGLAVVAVMLTPAGPAGILYPLRYIEPGDWGLANIAEWQSPDFHDPAHIGLLILVVGLAAVGIGRRVPAWLASVALIGLVLSLVSLRNEPIAAIWCLPLLAVGLDGRWSARATARSLQHARQRRLLELGLAGISILAILAILVPRIQPTDVAIARAGLPVDGVTYLANEMPDARVFAEYGWAGYVIDRLSGTGGTVFVDGRNDMYPDDVLDAYSSIREATGAWGEQLAERGVDAILVAPSAPLAAAAAAGDSGWCAAVEDASQVLLVRCATAD
ncbi:MAG: hypothetical protein ABI622_08640 [Chloroflexota bacterium]